MTMRYATSTGVDSFFSVRVDLAPSHVSVSNTSPYLRGYVEDVDPYVKHFDALGHRVVTDLSSPQRVRRPIPKEPKVTA